jgi:hypothetical protein
MPEFVSSLQRIPAHFYVLVAVMGYGPEFDSAKAAYTQLSTTNARIKCIPFGTETGTHTRAHPATTLREATNADACYAHLHDERERIECRLCVTAVEDVGMDGCTAAVECRNVCLVC